MDLRAVDVDPVLAPQRFRDVLVRDRPECLALLSGLEAERERDRPQAQGELLRVRVSAVLLHLLSLALLREMLQLARRGLDGQPTREEEVLGVAVGDVLHLTGAAETADLALQDDAHGLRLRRW